MSRIHPLAHVDRSTVGEGSRVWQFASIVRGSVIGDNSTVCPNATIDAAIIGSGTIIGHGANINPGVWIGDGCFIGPGAVMCNDSWPRADKDGFNLEPMLAGKRTIIIEDGASVGAHATILPGVRIGRNAMVAAHSIVSHNVGASVLHTRSGTRLVITAGMEAEQRKKRMRFAK